jgi:SAM-dependent methyltransferase
MFDIPSDFVRLNNGILADCGVVLPKDAMILDYGCGSGRFTYGYLDSGYPNSFGYDVKNYLSLRSPEDIRHFRFDENQGPADSYPRMSAVPWPDDTFDFVFATTVFEHVMDPKVAYREIVRVLKPGGLFLNDFPSKWNPIEPHMFVPFGGVIQNRLWFKFWAATGIRNGFQRGMRPEEVAEKNYYYSIHGIKYQTGGQIDRMLAEIFSDNRYVEAEFVRHTPGRSRYLTAPMKLFPPLRYLFRFAHTRFILSRK